MKSKKPICQKYFGNKIIDVFDLAIYYTSITFNNTLRHDERKWKMPSMYYSGLNEIFLLQPFDLNFFDGSQICNVYDRDQKEINCKDTDTLVLVTHRYNGMQQEPTIQRTGAGTIVCEESREFGAVSADEDTESLNLVIDFSSVPVINETKDLFLSKPSAYLGIRQGKDEPYPFTVESDRFYAVNKKDTKKGEVLKIKWKIDWENITHPIGTTLPSRGILRRFQAEE